MRYRESSKGHRNDVRVYSRVFNGFQSLSRHVDLSPRGMAQIPQNSVESADPKKPFFLVYCGFTIPHGSVQNGMDSALFQMDPWNLLRIFHVKFDSGGLGLKPVLARLCQSK